MYIYKELKDFYKKSAASQFVGSSHVVDLRSDPTPTLATSDSVIT